MVPLAYAAVGTFILSFDGNDGGTQFSDLRSVAVDSNDRILVGDGDLDSVQVFDSTGTLVFSFDGDDGINESPAGNSDGIEFNTPKGIAVDSNDRIIVVDSSLDLGQIYTSSGVFVGNLTGGALDSPQDVAVDSKNRIIVVDAGTENSVKIYDSSGAFVDSFDGTGGTQFSFPVSVAVDSNDRIIVGDTTDNNVQIYTSTGTFVTALTGGTTTTNPLGIAVDAGDRIFVADTVLNTIQIFDSSGAFESSFDGDEGDGTAFSFIDKIAIDSNNRIIVADSTVGTVQIYEGFPLPATGGGGSDQQWKTKPTFGLSHQTFKPLVDGGFSFNGVSHDIVDNWWTPFAEQKVKIGTTNTFTAKAYADKQLRVQEFLFGITEVGYAHKAELGVEIVYDYSGEVDRINVVQKTDIIDIDSIKVKHTKSKCQSDDTVKRCDTTTLSMKFLEPLQDKIMAIKAIDFKGRTHITYLNEGFDISGDSLNPMNTMMIPSTEKFEGLIEVTQTAKYSSIWSTQNDREFEMNEYGSFKQINQSFERHIDTGAFNRMHSEFADYKETQVDNAITQLLEYCPTCLTSFVDFKDSWAYEYSDPVDRLEILYYLMIIEEQKAIKVLDDAQLSVFYPNAEINLDDRPISVILAEERAMKKILADERFYLKQVLAPQQ